MPMVELRNLVDKDALVHSISSSNERLELAIKELSELSESNEPTDAKTKRSIVHRLKLALNGLQS
jgi:hypothetical protein